MDSNPKKYLLSYIQNKNYPLKLINFTNFSLSPSIISAKDKNIYEIEYENRIVSCFIMDQEIVVFLLGDYLVYQLYIYNLDNLEPKNKGNLPFIDKVNYENANKVYRLFYKGFHLKNRDAIFLYFLNINSDSLYLNIGTISDNCQSFNKKIYKNINKYFFNYDILLNDFIKINSERLIYISSSVNKNLIYILLIDLYNDYYSMNIRAYIEDFNNEHSLTKELSSDIWIC